MLSNYFKTKQNKNKLSEIITHRIASKQACKEENSAAGLLPVCLFSIRYNYNLQNRSINR